MANDKKIADTATFEINLLRLLNAEISALLVFRASREIFEKGYLSLSVAEKTMVDQAVLGMVGANYQSLTPELLEAQQVPQTKMGFAPAPSTPTPGTGTGTPSGSSDSPKTGSS
jgi:hypothetical protein